MMMPLAVPSDLRPLGLWTAPGPRVSYPHLGVVDSRIVDLGWYLGVLKADAVIYDLPVGEGRPAEEIEPGVYRDLYQSLTRFRVDLVLLHKGTLYVVEAKYEANPHALGQVLVYTDLVRQTVPAGYKVRPVILCWHELPDTKPTCDRLRVKVWQLKPHAEAVGIRDLGALGPMRVGDHLECLGLCGNPGDPTASV